jgi:hypothetical protein
MLHGHLELIQNSAHGHILKFVFQNPIFKLREIEHGTKLYPMLLICLLEGNASLAQT